MGLFGTTNDAISEEVEAATNENNAEDNWGQIMSICDKAGKTSENARQFLRAIVKRLYNKDPHIALQAVTLLDACIKNSGRLFHVEVASREFDTDFNKLMNNAHAKVSKQLRVSLKRWADNEFKTDQQLNLIPSLYSRLKSAGMDFTLAEVPAKKTPPISKDPNVVESQEEEDQILKAIELSLRETSSPVPRSAASSLYPSTSLPASSVNSPPVKEPKKVRALYDFEAAEDNELTFSSGEIIFVLDDSDPNWWKGSNQRGEGLFPSNFVTKDLTVEPEKFLYEKVKKIVQFKETPDGKGSEKEADDVEINEAKIDRLLHLLHEADPTNPERDTDEMLKLEREVDGMGPLIDSELEVVDRKHAQLTQLSADLVEALSLYHTLMREPQFPSINKVSYGYSPVSQPSTSVGYNGILPHNLPPNLLPGLGGLPPGHDRPPYMMSPGGAHFPSMSIPPGIVPNPSAHLSTSLHGIPPTPPPPPQHVIPQIPDDRRNDMNLGPYHSMPPVYCPVGGMMNFPPPGPQNVPNGPPPQQHFMPAPNTPQK